MLNNINFKKYIFRCDILLVYLHKKKNVIIMLTREEIFKKAYHDCMQEMYAKSQPIADYDNLLEEYKSGKIGENECVYDRHYLSREEFDYIRNKYKDAYNIRRTWVPNIEFLEGLLKDGGLKDKYIDGYTDEFGNHHPGYRSSEEVKPIKEQIEEIIKEFDSSEVSKELADKINNLIMDVIDNYKKFYRFDREEEEFDISICLGASPTSNPDTVKKWWKENYNQDIEIEERNPKLFWYQDNDYTDEDMEYEFDDPNWREILDKEWKEEKEKNKNL